MEKDKLRKLIIELQEVLNKERVEAKEWEDYFTLDGLEYKRQLLKELVSDLSK